MGSKGQKVTRLKGRKVKELICLRIVSVSPVLRFTISVFHPLPSVLRPLPSGTSLYTFLSFHFGSQKPFLHLIITNFHQRFQVYNVGTVVLDKCVKRCFVSPLIGIPE